MNPKMTIKDAISNLKKITAVIFSFPSRSQQR